MEDQIQYIYYNDFYLPQFQKDNFLILSRRVFSVSHFLMMITIFEYFENSKALSKYVVKKNPWTNT